MSPSELLEQARQYALSYLDTLSSREVFPSPASLSQLQRFDFSLPEKSIEPSTVIRLLHEAGSINTVASTGGRYFGFIFGGSLPAALAANWLSSTWDQNGVFKVSSPVAYKLETVASRWLLDLFELPANSAVGFVTGTTMANFTAVIAARHQILRNKGWNVKAKGLTGAPVIRIVCGEEIHASMQRALMLAGFGLDQLEKVPTDDQGRLIPEALPPLDDSTLLCIQCGNVNTGSIDPLNRIAEKAKGTGAWIHVDGAFGLWSRVSPSKSWMAEGCEQADSWAVDLHKWLNVPYDSGAVICKDAVVLEEALAVSASYLPEATEVDPYFHTPEMSRKARGIETWAALYSLGRSGVQELIERCCELAQLFADKLREGGFEILNDVVLNQVLVSFGDARRTNEVIRAIQKDGTCWAGPSVWKGRTAMRISVSSWSTKKEDIEMSAEAIIRIASTIKS